MVVLGWGLRSSSKDQDNEEGDDEDPSSILVVDAPFLVKYDDIVLVFLSVLCVCMYYTVLLSSSRGDCLLLLWDVFQIVCHLVGDMQVDDPVHEIEADETNGEHDP